MDINHIKNYFFVGIAGTGMSAIAQYLQGIGKNVSGSDRLFNQDNKMLIQEQFEKQGIQCFFQDGSGINAATEVVVVSTAIEESNVEYQKAKELGIPIIKRSELLAAISRSKRTIAVGGTSGKSTTTAMMFHILWENGYSPSLMTGAGLTSLQKQGLPGNAWVGQSDWLVIESDESDGSIVNYYPEIGVVLNVDRDHKEFDELMQLFATFKEHTHGAFIVNHDHPMIKTLSQNTKLDFGTTEGIGYIGKNFNQTGFQIQFIVNGIPFKIPVIGKHNMENAMAAIAVAGAIGIPVENAAKALENYVGIYRRAQLVGEKNGIYVIDDFAHNPAEVAAVIKACQQIGKRVFAWFQPHGYGPLRFMHEELAEKVTEVLREADYLIMSDVYYAGGTVNKDIGSDVVIDAIQKSGKNALLVNDRKELPLKLKNMAQPGDVILMMGARDPSLSDFAVEVLEKLNL
ncbi:MAG TPA: UDP-N-acetylmuramate--L-alanine ligase [Bacteroidales bacterium]|nr:UDP-N-acetylmuramate--L-alanine ligase [Bacteroidales bacterium]